MTVAGSSEGRDDSASAGSALEAGADRLSRLQKRLGAVTVGANVVALFAAIAAERSARSESWQRLSFACGSVALGALTAALVVTEGLQPRGR